ncbi:MAG: M48 family metallopeptidase [Planctomycetaceae bacterium]|nr:M48 family metallopeptidase [Planctomycetaceae bacterium]
MHMTILLSLMAAVMAAQGEFLPHWPAPSIVTAAAAALYVVGAATLARLANHVVLARAAQSRPRGPWGALLAAMVHMWLIAGSGAVVAAGYGQWLENIPWGVPHLTLLEAPLVGKVLLLLPMVAALMATWVVNYPCYRRSRMLAMQWTDSPLAIWSLGQYIEYNLRHQLLFILAPVGLILLAGDTLQLTLTAYLPETTVAALTLAASAAVFLVAPTLIVHVWKTVPLPAGPLRTDLETMSRQLRLTYRRLCLWQTGGAIANAAVMGLLRPVRYVLISDAVIERMDRMQVQAVFAHEAGHILNHHIFYTVVFIIASAMLATLGSSALADWLNVSEWISLAFSASVMVAIWVFLMGWISRRFERQCDVLAAWAGACRSDASLAGEAVEVFAQALLKISRLNGHDPAQYNWRHGSIQSRVDYLRDLAAAGGTRRQIDRQVRAIKLAILALAAAAVAMSVLSI